MHSANTWTNFWKLFLRLLQTLFMCQVLIHIYIQLMETGNEELIVLNKPLVDKLDLFVQLATHQDPQISEKAVKCLSIILKIHGDNTYEQLFSEGNISHILVALHHGNNIVKVMSYGVHWMIFAQKQ